jgi:hypothetical protein
MAAAAINHLLPPMLQSDNNNNQQSHDGYNTYSARVSISEIATSTDFGHTSRLRPEDFILKKTLGTGSTFLAHKHFFFPIDYRSHPV